MVDLSWANQTVFEDEGHRRGMPAESGRTTECVNSLTSASPNVSSVQAMSEQPASCSPGGR